MELTLPYLSVPLSQTFHEELYEYHCVWGHAKFKFYLDF
jgi:hypothetical protein